MAEGRAAVRSRVRALKSRLGRAEEPAEILKALELLQDLDVSLDILTETGIGKTVNSFRKHATAGNVAKSLVKKWKKLVPPENKSGHRERKQNTGKDEMKSSVSKEVKRKEVKPSEKSRTSVLASQSSNSSSISGKSNKKRNCVDKKHQSGVSESQKGCDNGKRHASGSKHTSQETSPQAKERDCKEKASKDNKRAPEKQCSCIAGKDSFHKKEKPKDASKQRDPEIETKLKEKLAVKREAELPGDEEFEPPTMSFESYLNYDQVTKKRKRKAGSTGKCPEKRSEQKSSSSPQKASMVSCANEGGEKVQNSEDDQSETPSKKAKVASLQDLLNTPLPKFLPDILISSPPYAADFKEPVVEPPQQVSEIVQFTGRRLNSKMQVYSGSKLVCHSKMLTLYELCIRVLQNNIDLLHEVGGVPFEILEPVLARCTPEQLLQVEECNPRFTEESDHLWKQHCQRDFKNESLLEYECWREMYLRLFNEREEKLKMLTKNIRSAQSEKPKGRQVKMADVTSAAKPPRNVRRQQGIHGTAGSATQLHLTDKWKKRPSESRDGNNNSSNSNSTSNSGSSGSNGMTQDGKKPIKKIAPIMKKTLKALKCKAARR
ncbi:elongin-A-like isoform X1 [Coturnix japonica]|uniref:Transcription elongation factor B polypeptide 3-like n=1 Tax=Coturnix japonica TaxID=93934 RepID=A0A8C2T813_COTJA|nr:elongin-A-like isoform X1 [Coturnix japonica]